MPLLNNSFCCLQDTITAAHSPHMLLASHFRCFLQRLDAAACRTCQLPALNTPPQLIAAPMATHVCHVPLIASTLCC
jgi:hypothetical protein